MYGVGEVMEWVGCCGEEFLYYDYIYDDYGYDECDVLWDWWLI